MKNETRVYRQTGAPELRQKGDASMIAGYAAVFNRLSQNLGGFVEDLARRSGRMNATRLS